VCSSDLEIVWSKPNGLPESVTDRVRRSHEQWFHFTLEPRYFSAIDEIREPQADNSFPNGRTFMESGPKGDVHGQNRTTRGIWRNPLGKLPGSVWSIPSEPLQVPDHLGVDHFAAFPQEWPRRLILGWCPQEVCSECGEGRAPVVDRTFDGTYNDAEAQRQRDRANMSGGTDRVTLGRTEFITRTITGYACACPDNTAPSTPGVVLDPFAGTGTVPMVARALGRTGIGIDLSADYLRLANWRVFESGHAAKTMRRTNQERQGTFL